MLNVRPFYGETTTAVRPPGFVEVRRARATCPPRSSRARPGDLRLGTAVRRPAAQRPRSPASSSSPGPSTPTRSSTVITASPLYGVRQWNFGQQNDQQFLEGLSQPGAQRARLDDRTLQRAA